MKFKKIIIESLKFIGMWLLLSIGVGFVAYGIKQPWLFILGVILIPVMLGLRFILEGKIMGKKELKLDKKLPSFDIDKILDEEIITKKEITVEPVIKKEPVVVKIDTKKDIEPDFDLLSAKKEIDVLKLKLVELEDYEQKLKERKTLIENKINGIKQKVFDQL